MQTPFLKHKLALAGLAAAVVFMTASMPKYVREFQSAQWPSTPGIVLETNLGIGYFRQTPGYYPKLTYNYKVSGQEYAGTEIDFHTQSHLYTPENAMSWLQKYPPGQAVTVYYDPQDPQQALLEPGIKPEQRWLFYIGLGYIVACSLAFVVVLYDWRNGGLLAARIRATMEKQRKQA